MARGVWTSGETRAEAEASIEADKHKVRIISCREIDLSGLPELRSGPFPRHWVVVIEDLTPELAAERPQHEDPEGEAERTMRRMYLTMALDPELLTDGVIEQFPCPSCGAEVRIELPPPREKVHPGHHSCPGCRAHLRLGRGERRWEVAPPRKRRDGRCIFCGDPADSQEHVIPEWISKQLGIDHIISMEGSIQPGPEPRTRPISFASYRAPIFCSGCNTHFKHLEDEALPLIVPMARGMTFALGQGEREVLSRWCLKTAIALSSAEPGHQDAIPSGHRRALRKDGRIIAHTWIGLFRWHGEPVISTGDGVLTDRNHPEVVRPSYSAMLAFEGFGFYVTALHRELAAGAPPGKDHPPMLAICPPRLGMIEWPPPMTDNRVLPRKLFTGWTPLRDP